MVSQDAHGRYQEAVYRGNVYTAANNAGAAWPVALSATATGMILSNPPTSKVNLSVLEITVAPTAFAAGQLSPLALAFTGSFTPVVHTTPLTITNSLLGSTNKSAANADSAATLPFIPYVVRTIGSYYSGSASQIKDDVGGALILAPGSSLSTFTLAGAALTAVTQITWEEIPI